MVTETFLFYTPGQGSACVNIIVCLWNTPQRWVKLNTHVFLKSILFFFFLIPHSKYFFSHKLLTLKTDEEAERKRNRLGEINLVWGETEPECIKLTLRIWPDGEKAKFTQNPTGQIHLLNKYPAQWIFLTVSETWAWEHP